MESVGKVTKSLAEALSAERKRQIRQRRPEEIAADVSTAVEEFAQEYVAYSRDVAGKRSWQRDVVSLKHILPVLGRYKLSAIFPQGCTRLQRRRLREGRKPATINREPDILSSLFTLARQRKKFFGENPLSRVKSLPAHNQVERIFSAEEKDRLLEVSPPYLRAILVTALNTGMRKSEIIDLKWSNVDLDNDLITLHATNTKSKKLRRVPLNSVLRRTLLEQKLVTGHQEYVFLNPNGRPYKRQEGRHRRPAVPRLEAHGRHKNDRSRRPAGGRL